MFTNDVSIWIQLVFNDKVLNVKVPSVKVEGGIEVLDLKCVNGKNDPILLEGVKTSRFSSELSSLRDNNLLIAKSS